MKEQIKDTHIYFPVEIREDMKEIARENRRTLSAEIIIAVERHIQQWRAVKLANAATAPGFPGKNKPQRRRG